MILHMRYLGPHATTVELWHTIGKETGQQQGGRLGHPIYCLIQFTAVGAAQAHRRRRHAQFLHARGSGAACAMGGAAAGLSSVRARVRGAAA